MSLMRSTVYVVDDDEAVLMAISRIVRLAGYPVRACSSAQAFLESLEPEPDGCIVLDVAMPGLDGMQLQEVLSGRNLELPIVFLSGHGDIPMSVQAIKRGAIDFLTKPVQKEKLLAAISAAMTQRNASRGEALARQVVRTRMACLTPRERQVMAQVVTGKPNKQIALELGTVEQTIKVHRGRVMHKMHAESLADLVRMADQVGLVSA